MVVSKKSDIPSNEMSLSVDCSFEKPPEENKLITIYDTNAIDLIENDIWISFFGFGKYKVVKSENMYKLEIHDGFSYNLVALKEI